MHPSTAPLFCKSISPFQGIVYHGSRMESLWFVIVLVFSVIIHELAHGYMAERLGDPTPRMAGRLTFNPLAHLDWFGSVILPLVLILMNAPFVIGWAKPVPFNPRNLRDKRWGPALVALAGPLSNILLAIIFALLTSLVDPRSPLAGLFASVVVTNVALAIFNLIPIPPLDGHHILFALLGRHAYALQRFLKRYSTIILIAFLLYGWQFISPLVLKMSNALLSLFS